MCEYKQHAHQSTEDFVCPLSARYIAIVYQVISQYSRILFFFSPKKTNRIGLNLKEDKLQHIKSNSICDSGLLMWQFYSLVFHWVVLASAVRVCNHCKDLLTFSSVHLLLSLHDFCTSLVLLCQINNFEFEFEFVVRRHANQYARINKIIYKLCIWCQFLDVNTTCQFDLKGSLFQTN